MPSHRKTLIAAGGVAAALTAAWVAAQRADRRAVQADPRRRPLFAEFGGRRGSVRAPDGTSLWTRTFGPEDAPTIIFIHGWTCAAEFWKLQVAALQGSRRIVTYDQRGHGQSERPANGDYSIEAFAGDLDAVIAATVPEGERAMLVGHSLGAMTIVSWAGANPEQVDSRVSSAVLLDSGVSDLLRDMQVFVGDPDRAARLRRLLGEGMMRAPTPVPSGSSLISKRVIRTYVVGPDASPATVGFCEHLVTACPTDVRTAVGLTLTRLDIREALPALAAPTLVIAGERDRLTPPKHAHFIGEALPDLLDVAVLERSGHMSPLEFPDEVNALVAELAGTAAEPLAAA